MLFEIMNIRKDSNNKVNASNKVYKLLWVYFVTAK